MLKNKKILFLTSLILILINLPVAAQGQMPIYRLYNKATNEHLYSSNHEEVMVLVTQHGWKDEGTGWIAPDTGTPVFRLFNPGLSEHLYTSDQNEINSLVANNGWVIDNNGGPLFFSSGGFPVYRLYNPKTKTHHLTTDANEYQVLAQQGWRQEGASISAVGLGNPNPTTPQIAPTQPAPTTPTQSTQTYVCNTRTMKFHYPSCSSVGKMSANNRKDVNSTRDQLIFQGYSPCKNCHP